MVLSHTTGEYWTVHPQPTDQQPYPWYCHTQQVITVPHTLYLQTNSPTHGTATHNTCIPSTYRPTALPTVLPHTTGEYCTAHPPPTDQQPYPRYCHTQQVSTGPYTLNLRTDRSTHGTVPHTMGEYCTTHPPPTDQQPYPWYCHTQQVSTGPYTLNLQTNSSTHGTVTHNR